MMSWAIWASAGRTTPGSYSSLCAVLFPTELCSVGILLGGPTGYQSLRSGALLEAPLRKSQT